jgi:Prefoldin subunit
LSRLEYPDFSLNELVAAFNFSQSCYLSVRHTQKSSSQPVLVTLQRWFVNEHKRDCYKVYKMAQSQPPPAVMQHFRKLVADGQAVQTQITALEMDRNEHILVEETLKPLDPQRRAFRLVGECLVERTVGEVLPTVAANRENVRFFVVVVVVMCAGLLFGFCSLSVTVVMNSYFDLGDYNHDRWRTPSRL